MPKGGLMREPRGISSQAEFELAQLREQGCTLTDADVVRINALCCEIENSGTRSVLARGRPKKVGGVWLWPMTISAYDWYYETGSKMPNDVFALAYAMAHGTEELETVEWDTVRKWSKAIKATKDELKTAIECVLAQDERDEMPKQDGPDYSVADMARLLHAMHGGDIEMWERRVSIGYVFEVFDTLITQVKAGSEEARNMVRDRANYILACAIEEIRKRGKAEVNG